MTAAGGPRRQAIPVAGVHPGLHLEDDRTERVGHFAQPAVDVRASGGGGGEFHQRLEQLPHPEVEHRRREDHRRGLPGEEQFLIVVLAHLGEQFALLGRGHPRVALPLGGDVGGALRGHAGADGHGGRARGEQRDGARDAAAVDEEIAAGLHAELRTLIASSRQRSGISPRNSCRSSKSVISTGAVSLP